MVSTIGREKSPRALTWGELLRSEAMRETDVPVAGELDREVRWVRLISDVEDVRACRPGTIVVLQQPIAGAAWAVEIAVRYAWERNVLCVISQVDESARDAVTRLSERLTVPVGFQDGDLLDFALRLAAQVTRPEAVRSRLVAVCASRVADQTTVAGVLEALNEELPGVQVGLTGLYDVLIAGVAPRSDRDGEVLSVPLKPLDYTADRKLVASVPRGSAAWVETVTRVLTIARGQIVACESADRLALASRSQHEARTLAQIAGLAPSPTLSEPPGERPDTATLAQWGETAAQALGWVTRGPLVGAVLLAADARLTSDESFGLSLRGAWATGRSGPAPVPYGEGWALWSLWEPPTDPELSADDLQVARRRAAQRFGEAIRKRLTKVRLGIGIAVGVGEVVDHERGLAQTLSQAMIAARAARSAGEYEVALFADLGPRAFLAATDVETLRNVARDVLSPLVEVEDFEQLAETLAVYFDSGGSTSRAAARLDVHRNTVTGRIDRIRRAGVPVDDPDQRLALHVACYLLSQKRTTF